MTRTLDRLVEFDDRSRSFPIRQLVAEIAPRSYTWRLAPRLDQGREGACVGFAWCHELAARPVVVAEASEPLAVSIYREAQTLDVWPGESYAGTSVLAGAKAVAGRGWMTEYRWAFGLEDLILAVGNRGPAVLGVNWHEGMFAPDARGQLHVSGDVVGGHAILCNGVNVRLGRFLLTNSWGPSWGNNGTAWMSFGDMAKLLDAEGEACLPIRRQQRA